MKICIVSAVNIKHMSMVTFYTDYFKNNNISYDLIYFDKYGVEESIGEQNKYVYRCEFSKNTKKIQKIKEYYKYKKFASKILLNNDYDFIVLWNDLAIHLLGSFLSDNFPNRYCVNIRDYFGQDIPLISKNVKKAVRNSSFNTVSSKGYEEFLPPEKYYMMHSIIGQVSTDIESTVKEKSSFPLKLSFVGNIRFFEQNKRILDIFKNNKKFQLQYFGTNANVLKEYCEINSIYNAEFHDSFDLSETSFYVKKGDLVNNIYGKKDKILNHSISIKLYHSVLAKQPIIAMNDTYIGNLVQKYSLGFVIDHLNHDLPALIEKWYSNLNYEEYLKSCKKFIEEARMENQVINELLDSNLRKIKNKG
ncbi:hypothetical protein [Exiguobacterium sp. s183]|uniref:hypothetical protein n=1 Tax=Exiguobacterium sp. s183 TaxID=2751262 RepID=UPI001BE78C7B|nr:hypothetical protein [Exiguobacterium sp. s183]